MGSLLQRVSVHIYKEHQGVSDFLLFHWSELGAAWSRCRACCRPWVNHVARLCLPNPTYLTVITPTSQERQVQRENPSHLAQV